MSSDQLAVVLCALLLSLNATPSLAASLQPVEDFGPNPGNLGMYVYVPDGHQPGSALVVALHGCKQQASDFDDETGLEALADARKFVLVFPEQDTDNHRLRCFNWFETEDITRNEGESGSIRNMIQYAMETYGADPERVFILGLSAGGSMTGVMLANYPELFEGGAIVAGSPYDCNRPSGLYWAWWWWLHWSGKDDAAAVYACGLFGKTPTQRSPEAWGDYVRAAAGTTPTRWPTVSLWQGTADPTVHPGNHTELVKQWTNVHGIDQTPVTVTDSGGVTHRVYGETNGKPALEAYEIADFDHGIAIDPDAEVEPCGTAAPYILDAGICSARKIVETWGLVP